MVAGPRSSPAASRGRRRRRRRHERCSSRCDPGPERWPDPGRKPDRGVRSARRSLASDTRGARAGRTLMKLRYLAVAVAALAVVISACGGTGGTSTATGSASLGPLPDVKIGLATSKTGAANFYNPQQTNGAQLAVDQFNATGGFHNRRPKIQLIIYGDGKFELDDLQIFKDAFKANGVTVAKEIPYRATDVDFAPFVTAAKAENPDAIVASSLAGPAGKILDEITKQMPGKRVIGGNGGPPPPPPPPPHPPPP